MTSSNQHVGAPQLRHQLQAARELLRATERLGRAVHDDDFENLGAALEERQRCFDAVRSIREGVTGELRTLLSRVSALDQRILAAAQAVHQEIRIELESLATARRAARAFLPVAAEPARFVAERV